MAAEKITTAVMLLINCGLLQLVVAQGGSPNGSSFDETNLRAKGLVLVKIWCLIIVFLGTFGGGISPYFFRWNESFLLLGSQFAAGVFLGTAWMHYLSDSAGTFGDLTDKTYPFAFMLCTAGYLFTMLADVIVVWVYEKQDRPSIHGAHPVERIADIGDTESGVPTHTHRRDTPQHSGGGPPNTAPDRQTNEHDEGDIIDKKDLSGRQLIAHIGTDLPFCLRGDRHRCCSDES